MPNSDTLSASTGSIGATNCVACNSDASKKRLIMLLGTARSGTTWLGNILNSSPKTVYSHEPLLRLPDPSLLPLLRKIRETAQLTDAERDVIFNAWSRAYYATRRPPFFAKDHSAWPAKAVWAAWLAVQATRRGYSAFERTFSPKSVACYDLVVKQGGLMLHAENYIRALRPERLIVIMRHPCAVIASLLRGQKLGLMAEQPRGPWLDLHEHLCDRHGYSRPQVEVMSEAEFLALGWLIENSAYQRLLDRCSHSRLVLYKDLCSAPLSVTASLYDSLGWTLTRQTRKFLGDTSGRKGSPLKTLVTASHSYYSIYRKPQETSQWKHEITPREQEGILAISKPLLKLYWAS